MYCNAGKQMWIVNNELDSLCVCVFSALVFVQTGRQKSQAGRKMCSLKNIALVLTCLIIFFPPTTASLEAQLSTKQPDSSNILQLIKKRKES